MRLKGLLRSVHCGKCGNKIRFFKKRKGNEHVARLCMDCHTNSENRPAAVIKKPIDKKTSKEISNYVNKYIMSKGLGLDSNIHSLFSNINYSGLFLESDLDNARAYFRSLNELELTVPKPSNKSMEANKKTKRMGESALSFCSDLEKLKKVLERKEIFVDYWDLVAIFGEIIGSNLEKEMNKSIGPISEKIMKKVGKKPAKEDIVMEFARIPNKFEITEDSVSCLLRKFKLESDPTEIENLLHLAREEAELHHFEKMISFSNDRKK